MSQRAYALRQRRKLHLTRGVAGFLVVLLVAAVAVAAADLTAPDEATRSDPTPAAESEPDSAKPSDILTASTASPAIDSAIAALIAAERFRFELLMKPVGASGKTSWKVVGEADLATALDDPPRLHAQVALGSDDSYSVVSEQLRVGDAMFDRDVGTGEYRRARPSNEAGDLGAVDPVSTILSSLAELPASAFTELPSSAGTTTVVVRAAAQEIEGGITSMRVVLDDSTGALRSMSFQSAAMKSRVAIGDLGDPSIDIVLPSS